MSVHKATYASQAQLRRAISALSKQNLRVGSVVLHPDGAIEVQLAGNDNAHPRANDFDRLEAAGVL